MTIVIALVIFAMWDPARAILGAILFGGINAVQFRLQAAGTTIPAAYLNMAPYIMTILVLVMMTWWETLSKRVGAPSEPVNMPLRKLVPCGSDPCSEEANAGKHQDAAGHKRHPEHDVHGNTSNVED